MSKAKTMGYTYLEELTTADIAFEASGKTLEELFQAAADATTNLMLTDLTVLADQEQREIVLEADNIEYLLYDFLGRLLYYKDSERLLLRVPNVEVKNEDSRFQLRAVAVGEQIDPHKHPLGVDVKAVTMHKFKVVPGPQGWKATVILDV